MTMPKALQDPPDFSLVLGGPVYQLFRRAHLAGPALEHLKWRVLFIVAIAWLPLLCLSAISGHLLGGMGLPFIHDIETHVRFLVAVPVLVIAELFVHERSRSVVKSFMERGIVTPEDNSKFHAIIEAAVRARNSMALEIALLIFVYTVGHWVWLHDVALGTASWYAVYEGSNLHLTLPGYWYGFVSIPIAQFIVFRWYLRIINWFWLLGRVSRLNLRLEPAHPDHAGGIGFVGRSAFAFGPVLFAQGAMLAGVIASRLLYEGQNLMSFKFTIVAFVGFFLMMVLGPLVVFSPLLARTKRLGLAEYGTLATSYTRDFDEKWLRGRTKDKIILGTADIQSLADLASSYSVVRTMHLVPFSYNDALSLVAATAVPLLPLLLTIMPVEELLQRLIKIIF